MNKMSIVKKSIITAVCIALCVVLPQAFHAIPNAGSIYCPMHIPVLLCGIVCGWQYGLFCGIAGPLLSSLFTGMPPAAVLPPMMIECAVYGIITGLMMKFVYTKKTYADLYISLITAMLAGRIAAGIAKALIFARGEINRSMGNNTFCNCSSGHSNPPRFNPGNCIRTYESPSPSRTLS